MSSQFALSLKGFAISSVLALTLIFSGAPVSQAFILQELPYYRTHSSLNTAASSTTKTTPLPDFSTTPENAEAEKEKQLFSSLMSVAESKIESLLEGAKNEFVLLDDSLPDATNQEHHRHKHRHHLHHHEHQKHQHKEGMNDLAKSESDKEARKYRNDFSSPLDQKLKRAVDAFQRRKYLCARLLIC